jgi:hypothetical protein
MPRASGVPRAVCAVWRVETNGGTATSVCVRWATVDDTPGNGNGGTGGGGGSGDGDVYTGPDVNSVFVGPSGTCWRYSNGPSQEPCPPGDPAGTPPIPGWMYRAAARNMIKPPPPQLFIAPGFAIPGKRAFLETGGPEQVFGDGTAFGSPLSWDCRYDSSTVQWSGIPVTGHVPFHRRNAGPWPNGGVSHVFDEPGPVSANVRERWLCYVVANGVTLAPPIPLQSQASFAMNVREFQVIVTEGDTVIR